MMTQTLPLRDVKKLLNCLEELRAIDRDMPIQVAVSLLYIALYEGASQIDLSTEANISTSAMSRNVALLSDIGIRGRKGFGLVTSEPDPTERRRKVHMLTADGRALMRRLAALVETYSDESEAG